MLSIARRIGVTALRGNFRKCSTEISPWLLDNKPGPYPKTEEEKIAAAKKYGLLREEYEPFPNDGSGYGDYPQTRIEPIEDLNWHYPWTDNLSKRNFGDPIHPEHAFYTYARISSFDARMPLWKCVVQFLTPIAIIIVLLYTPSLNTYCYRYHTLEKQIPQPGVVHYSFETVD